MESVRFTPSPTHTPSCSSAFALDTSFAYEIFGLGSLSTPISYPCSYWKLGNNKCPIALIIVNKTQLTLTNKTILFI